MKKIYTFGLFLLSSILCACGQSSSIISSPSSSISTSSNTSTITSTNTTTTVAPSTTSSPEEYTKLSISDFLKYKDSKKYYILEGKITNLTDDRYGNFDLEDSTGKIFVYGLLENKGATDKKWFTNSGLKEGDTITLAGKYLNYNGKDEVSNAYFISKSSSDSGSTTPPSDDYQYLDFTSDEKALFNQKIGFVVAFAPTDEYYVDDYPEYGFINYYSLDMTKLDFENYKTQCKNLYTYDGSETEGGITYYIFSYKGTYIDICYYQYEFSDGYTSYIIDVYCYYEPSEGGDVITPTPSVDGLITNKGKGLPSSDTGIYDVDFTKASPLKDVHDQGYYLDGCPTVGNVNVLVIPVQFSDSLAKDKDYSLEKLDKAFNDTETIKEYPSVKEYYYESSYKQLNLNFEILDTWYTASKTSSYYINLDNNNDGNQVTSEQLILEEALTNLDDSLDFNNFDSDNNGSIDAIVMINTLDINYDNDLQWAFRYWNTNVDDQGYYYEHDEKYANDYLWASYQFLCESDTGYNDMSATNTYTYIHEFGHVLGADDYYDTSYSELDDIGLSGFDIMDSSFGDHNPYTKFNYGWITSSKLVVTNSSITIDLEDFSKSGDTIIITNNFDPNMGVYQEYYVLMYYTNNGINSLSNAGYFKEEGILMYHVNASYYMEEYYGETYYDVYNNNTIAGEYASENMLIEYVKNDDDFIYSTNDSSSINIIDDNNEILSYSFKVNSLTQEKANLTITKN